MAILRSILPFILVLITTFLVSCGGSVAKAPPTYTTEKIAQIQTYAIPIKEAQKRMSTLQGFINNENWVDTRSFIHGPLGALRQQMGTLSRSLLPEDQKQVTELAKEISGHFEKLDAAASEKNYTTVIDQYREALKDLNSLVDLIPEVSSDV